MNYDRLNTLIEKITLISQHSQRVEIDPLLQESLTELKQELKVNYGEFLSDKLFEFYEDYFEDNEMENLDHYLAGEVQVFGDELDQEDLLLSIKASPVRIEVSDPAHHYHNVLWQATSQPNMPQKMH